MHTFPNTAMNVTYQAGAGWAGPAVVRRACAYLQEHAEQPISLEQLAEAVGTSARTLQSTFRRYLQVTPMGYLRRVRLERAADELRAADPASGITVAAVGRRWGWASARQFTAAFRRQIGELPSHTLRW
ncbi:helix-turn-helix transcriptional regulator [Cryptosporangium phraense]|uniref:Helix-turn-helix transcriptional regulator n=1 Tax=Cryptosporangium phraense TaxID=2593070 RepID=A0A545AUS8_9ACTN|nr:helix-turn-helix transcriptional regulator [Cryptosporangium phraense]TQS45082.1 helix-turn-helix transcriptional regulator [Cryptosporangium phraense]